VYTSGIDDTVGLIGLENLVQVLSDCFRIFLRIIPELTFVTITLKLIAGVAVTDEVRAKYTGAFGFEVLTSSTFRTITRSCSIFADLYATLDRVTTLRIDTLLPAIVFGFQMLARTGIAVTFTCTVLFLRQVELKFKAYLQNS
jgi:hypothetical protein